MNVVKTSQLSIVEFLKYVSDGQQHLHYITDRKKSNCQSRRSHWVTKKTSKRHQSLPWKKHTLDPFQDDTPMMNSADQSPRRAQNADIYSGSQIGPTADSIFEPRFQNDPDGSNDGGAQIGSLQTLERQLANVEGSNIKLLDIAEATNIADMEFKGNALQMALTQKLLEHDEKLLSLSRLTTPDALSMDGEDRNKNEESQMNKQPPTEDFHEADETDSEYKKAKPHSQYIVRLKKPPQFQFAKNKFDAYLTKTSMRAIKFTENKKRWMRLIENDLYSKTEGRGIPRLQRVEIKDNQFVKSPPFFRENHSSRVSVSELKSKNNSQLEDSQQQIETVASLKLGMGDFNKTHTSFMSLTQHQQSQKTGMSRKHSGYCAKNITAVSFQEQPDEPKGVFRGGNHTIQAPLQNSKIKNKFRNMPGGSTTLSKTVQGTAVKQFPHSIGVAKLTSIRGTGPKVGTPNTMKVSSVHERRCKADENDEMLIQSRDTSRGASKGRSVPRSGHSEIRSRISGKQTADSKKERGKLGPGDDHMIRMRVLNSYKQIKFNQVGIGGKPAIFNKLNVGSSEMMQKIDELQGRKGADSFIEGEPRANKSFFDEATRKDSIYPSDQEGEDQQTQTMFEPFKTTDHFGSTKLKPDDNSRNKTTFSFDKQNPSKQRTRRPIGLEHILKSPKVFQQPHGPQHDKNVRIQDNRFLDSFQNQSLQTSGLRHTHQAHGFPKLVPMNTTQQSFNPALINNDIIAEQSLMLSSFQIGGQHMMQNGKAFYSQRNSNQMNMTQPLRRSSVALNMDSDIEKFGTWRKFNAEFERRLGRRERATAMRIKKQKGENFKYPSTIWRSP